MKIVIFAEGDTERAAKDHLKRFLDDRAEDRPKVGLQTSIFDGSLDERGVSGRAEKYLADPSVCGIIALVDLYPQFPGGIEEARRTVRAWLPADPRCAVHVAKHDFEAWLLHGWPAIVQQSGVTSNPKPWGTRPEDINHNRPPAHRLRELFAQGKPPRKYKKPIDGKKLFEKLDLAQVATLCPELRAFLNTLLRLSGYPLL